MAIAFRSTNGSTYGTGTSNPNIVVSKPSGVADGDLLVASFYCDDSTMSTVPTGWTLIKEVENTYASPHFWIRAYWKRASSEGANWTWVTSANVWYAWEVVAYTGGLASGDPLDGTATSWSNPDSAAKYQVLLPAVTTTVDGSMLVAACGNFDGRAWTSGTAPVTNERVDQNGLTHYDGIKTPAGSSGTITISIASSDANQIAGVLFALKPAADGPAAVSGTATFRAQPAQLTASGTVTPPARTGTASASAQAPRLSATGTQAISGTASLSAQSASLASSGAETFTGSASLRAMSASLASQGAESFAGTASETGAPARLAAVGTTSMPSFTGTANITLAGASVSGTGANSSSPHQVLVGNGYTDVTPQQFVRTSDDRAWVASWKFVTYPEGNHPSGTGQTLMMYRADGVGVPGSFTRQDSAGEPVNVISWSMAVDSSDLIHVAYVTRQSWDDSTFGVAGALFYVTFDTASLAWGAPESIIDLADMQEIGQGDELIALALDADGVPHVAHCYTDGTRRRIGYRNRIGGAWSAPTQIDPNDAVTYSHPGIAFDRNAAIVVTFISGDYLGAGTGQHHVRVYSGGSWGAVAHVQASANVWVGIDTGSRLYIDEANRYHLAALTGGTDKYIGYWYSDDSGATWAANHPGGGTTVGDDPAPGPGQGGRVRVYAHGTDATPNIVYFEGAGGDGAWDASVDYFPDTATAYDCTVNVRWSRYFHVHSEHLDVAYWQSVYDTANGNQLYIGSDPDFRGPATVTVQPAQLAASANVVPPAVTGSASVTLGAVQISASGIAATGIAGTAAVSLQSAQVSASGSVTPPAITGTASVTAQPAGIAATGSVGVPGVTGTGSVIAQASQVAAAAWEAYEGMGSASGQASSTSGAGEVIPPAIAGVVVMALAAATMSASGTVAMSEYTGTAAMILAPIAIAATGTGAVTPQIGTAALAVSILYTASLSVAALGAATITVEAG